MADLDRELLQLAGGDSSDEDEPQQMGNTTKAESASPLTDRPGAVDNSISTSKVSATPKVSARSTIKKGRPDESEEEGEASSASGSQLESAPMSESDADQSPRSDTSAAIFPVDNKFYSEKDKAEIMALSEVRREAILAERAAILERKTQDQILRKLYQGYQAKEGDKSKSGYLNKRKAGAAELEDVQRKSSRQKTTLGGRKVGETSDAMEAYKRQREQKGIIAEQRKTEAAERKARKGHRSASDGSDADADGESEVEWDDGKARAGDRLDPSPRDVLPAEMVDFNRIRVGRDNFASVCFTPSFDDLIKNCYTRVSIGPDRVNNELVYRMALIKGITEGKPYAIEGSNGKFFTTTQYVLVSIGKSEREWPFIACSNSGFTLREYERYIKTMTSDGFTLPIKATLISKIDSINKLINHRWTDAEIQEKLKRSGVLQRKSNSIERAQLNARRKEAEATHDEEAITKIDANLKALEGPKLAFNTTLSKPVVSPKGKTQQERLADLNRANRKANTRDVRKAQQAERKAALATRAAIERGEAVADPFARVKVYAKTHHDVNNMLGVPKPKKDDLFSGSDGSRAVTPVPTTETTTPKKDTAQVAAKMAEVPVITVPNSASTVKNGPWMAFRPSQCDEDAALASYDFGIDFDALMAA